MHVLVSWLVMCSSPLGPSHHLPLFEILVPNTLWTWCVRLISQCFYFCYENLRKLAFAKWWHLSDITQKHSETVCDPGKRFKLSVRFCFHVCTFTLELFSRLTSNPALASVSLFAPISPSVQAPSCPSPLSHLFKDGCAGRRLAGWSDGLWR